MLKNGIWLLLCTLVVVSLLLVSCETSTTSPSKTSTTSVSSPTATPATSIPVTPTQTHWWDALGEPEYGGEISLIMAVLDDNFDPWLHTVGTSHWIYERLILSDPTIPPEVWPFKVDYVPASYVTGALAESWEWTDPTTMTVHIRHGIHWQDKPPVNGREFTAYDVQYHYDRQQAFPGSGFTEKSLSYSQWFTTLAGITATDNYTVIFKFKQPGIVAFWQFADQTTAQNVIEPKESVDAGGGKINDWKIAVGTGAWMVTDYLASSYETLTANPNYWGYDERYPKNKLPYADALKVVVIPDPSTVLAALRTGKGDILSAEMIKIDWQHAVTLAQTNPEIKQVKLPAGISPAVTIRVDNEPFTDIRVRKALQMAMDLPALAKSYYGGTIDGTPCGFVSPIYKGYCYPYDEWPQELKDEYSYNPERAKELLAEAGYPTGFKTEIITSSSSDLQLIQVIKAQFKDIGVDAEITMMDITSLYAYAIGRKHKAMVYGGGSGTGSTGKPGSLIHQYYSKDVMFNFAAVNDPGYDALVERSESALNEEDAGSALKAADKLVIEQHWAVFTLPTDLYTFYQQWLKGYNGEKVVLHHSYQQTARWWIDQDLKKSMGH